MSVAVALFVGLTERTTTEDMFVVFQRSHHRGDNFDLLDSHNHCYLIR